MKTTAALLTAILSISVLIGACASSASQPSDQYGVVKSINPTTESNSGINVGTVIGGVLGGLAGHQVGGGSGQTVATIGGAVGGAVIGTDVDNHNSAQMYKIGVRLNDGQFVTVNQKASIAAVRVGDRVKLEDGEVHPV